jgi:LuxR family maltose regulon positive regulatory protein
MLQRIGRYSFPACYTDSPAKIGPLLASKLAPPPWRGGLIDRPRLAAQLNQAEPQQAVLLAAPTGFGKTTLLNGWARQADRAVAWITLDEADNDPARFGAYFVAALDALYPGIGAALRPVLKAPPPVPIEWGVVGLLNAIAARPEAITLVLDDCHTIHAPEIHQGLAFLIDHLPANLSIVLASRVNPPLPLARWRARRQLIELRADALRFSADEAARLFAAMRVRLSEQEIGLLTAQAEGWAAGLYLAARALDSEPGGARLLHSFSGSNRFVADYLLDEVLARLPDQVQQFLLGTSILRRLNAALCDAVIDRPGSQAMLERLESDNLLIPLDPDRQWFRHHQVFAEFFRVRLERLDPQLPAILHRRAAEWYAEHEASASAVEHALLADEIELAMSLIDAQAAGLIERGELAWVAGERAADAQGSQPEPLSAREREVLRKLAQGRSNQEIARELFISVATVKTHLIHIYRKLGARTRTAALAQARAQHLL